MKGAHKWGTDEVVAWLESEGLRELSSVAREQGFDGPCLFALFNETKKETNSYRTDCTDLGITTATLQMKLKGRLATLFG